MFSKTREGGRDYSRRAGFHELSLDNTPAGQIKGTTKIGAVSVDQLQLGVQFPNVQSAIDDIANLYQHPIGAVVASDDQNIDFSGVNMVERLTVSGTVTGGPAGSDTFVEVYGIPVKVQVGQNDVAVTIEVLKVLNTYKTNGIAIKDVIATSGVNNAADVTFLDTKPHKNYLYNKNGISIIGQTSTAAIPGYGTWAKIGSADIDGVTGGTKVKLHYFKRVA